MKILLVTDLYPIENSSEPKTIRNFALNWKKLGHDVEVIRPNFLLNTFVRKRKIFPEKIYYDNDIKIYNINCITPFWFNVRHKLPKDFQIGAYDIVISHMPCGALFAMKIAGRCMGIPYVCSVHASDLKVITDKFYKIFFAKPLLLAYKRANAISARNNAFAEEIKKLSVYADGKTFIAPSGIPKEWIEDEEVFVNKSYSEHKPLVISTVAKLIKRKNINIIIEALNKTHYRNFILRIMGDGPEMNNLKNLAKKYNLEEQIIFEGEIPHEEVLTKLRMTDLFILVSESETFGIAYLEAAARGNIVIATENGGLDGIIINGKNGYTCTPNSDKLAELIDKIVSTPQEEIKNILLSLRETLLKYDDVAVSEKYLSKAFSVIKEN